MRYSTAISLDHFRECNFIICIDDTMPFHQSTEHSKFSQKHERLDGKLFLLDFMLVSPHIRTNLDKAIQKSGTLITVTVE